MKHQKCSDCEHKIFRYEMRIKSKDHKWQEWIGLDLRSNITHIKEALDIQYPPQSITRNFKSYSYEYRRTP